MPITQERFVVLLASKRELGGWPLGGRFDPWWQRYFLALSRFSHVFAWHCAHAGRDGAIVCRFFFRLTFSALLLALFFRLPELHAAEPSVRLPSPFVYKRCVHSFLHFISFLLHFFSFHKNNG